jgi:hypothetical protein
MPMKSARRSWNEGRSSNMTASEKVEAVLMENKRFLEKVKAFKAVSTGRAQLHGDGAPLGRLKELAAMRRASLDLTRALAELRRSAS